MSRTSKKRGQDQAVELDGETQSASRVWAIVRGRYPADVARLVDQVAEAGGLSLHDVELMEMASHATLDARIKSAERRKQHDLAAKLRHLQGQSRKHIRTLRLMMEPIVNPNKNRHRDPEAEAGKGAAKVKALADLAGADVDDADTGDELVS